jgi:hypothetical protein
LSIDDQALTTNDESSLVEGTTLICEILMTTAMITEEELVQEFIAIVNRYYPVTGKLLQECHVKVITTYWGKPPRRMRYVGIYCPEQVISRIQADLDVLSDVAENMGLAQVICRNAHRLLRDPASKLKHSDPRFWLELHWMISQKNLR